MYRFEFPAARVCDFCREAELIEQDERKARVLLAQAEIPKAYAECSFADFAVEPGTQHAFTMCSRWSADVRHERRERPVGRGLLLYGPEGSGKTHLAVAILKEVVYARSFKSLYLNVPDWLNSVREAWHGEGADQPPNPNGYELIVIDDLGAENATAWSRERIYSLINHRWQNDLFTLITTNLTPAEIRAKLGRATASRITTLCANVPFEPQHDYRELLAKAAEGR